QTANGLQSSLLGVRAGLESFPVWTTGVIMACYYIGNTAAPLASRATIGRPGQVNVIWLGAIGAGLAIAGHAVFVAPVPWSLLRLFSGFALSSLYVAAESWIHARVDNAERGRVFSIYMVAQLVGMTLAQGLLSVADPKTAVPFLIAALIFLAGGVPVIATRAAAPERSPPEPFGLVHLFRASPLGASMTLLAGASWSVVFAFGPVYAQRAGFDLGHISLFMGLAMIGGGTVQFPMGWLSDGIGRRRTLMLIAFGGLLVSLYGLWANSHGAFAILAGALLTGALIFPIYGISAAHTNDQVSAPNRVAAAAGLVLLFGIGSIFRQLLSGAVMTRLGNGGYYVVL